MQIEMIYATDPNGIIGLKEGNQYSQPFHSKKDFHWFRQCTYDQIVIMGYNTYKAIGSHLRDRHNIVLSSSDYAPVLFDSLLVTQAFSIQQALYRAYYLNKNLNANKRVIFIGGKSIYEQIEPFVNKIYITQYDQYVDTDNPEIEYIRYIPRILQSNFTLKATIPFEDTDKYLDIPLTGEFQVWQSVFPTYLTIPQPL